MGVINRLFPRVHRPSPEVLGKMRKAVVATGLTVGVTATLIAGNSLSSTSVPAPSAPAPVSTPKTLPAPATADHFRLADGRSVSFKFPDVLAPPKVGPLGSSKNAIGDSSYGSRLLPEPIKPPVQVTLVPVAARAAEVTSIYASELPQLKPSPRSLEVATQAEAAAVTSHRTPDQAMAAVHEAVVQDLDTQAQSKGVTAAQLQAIIPTISDAQLATYTRFVNLAMLDGDISTPARMEAFLGEMNEETAGLQTLTEYASGADYNGRTDLGNTQPNDGVRFKGRGGFQTTGRTNYETYGADINQDLVAHPELAADPSVAFLTAADYWNRNGLSAPADRGDINAISKAINGGTNGQEVRQQDYEQAKKVLG